MDHGPRTQQRNGDVKLKSRRLTWSGELLTTLNKTQRKQQRKTWTERLPFLNRTSMRRPWLSPGGHHDSLIIKHKVKDKMSGDLVTWDV